LFPIASLPACASQCGFLFDVNGACVPPAKPEADASVYDSCFCSDPRLTAFKTTADGVCPANVCAPADLTSIQGWYNSFCGNAAAAGTTGTTSSTSTSTSSPNNDDSSGGGDGGTWLQSHYQWVIFLVIMVVAIIGIWVGACVWRRRYLRKKDTRYALGHNLAHQTGSGRVVPNGSNAGSVHVPGAGMFQAAPLHEADVYEEKKAKKEKKKKWIVRQRT
ncbi:hypothetical protein B0T17DRAFT_493275, partial [Bombardia bombarda]